MTATESTNLTNVGRTLTLDFENSSPEDAERRLEDVLGLLFDPDRKSFKLELTVQKGGRARAVKTTLQGVLIE